MKIIEITPNLWEKYRWPLLLFIRRYEKGTDHSLYRWLFHLKKNDINKPGTCISLAFWEGQMIGATIISRYGIHLSELILLPAFLHKHFHKRLIDSIIDRLGVFYTKVRYNDEKMIKTALESGLVCFSYEQKQNTNYLWFGGGHWNIEDVVS
ncbi:hypothetical protein [Bacillus sp. JCM 19034]|uniref:hypothetical protein n=1 Tax=Bacillus sp. JCM 19034 TaxID=1481928 RepID=UPI000783BBD7|nr:hypothetical protein [Bacillus sp. JCM 19034]